MKSKLIKILLLVLTFSLSLGIVTACGGEVDDGTHKHNYSILKYNFSGHWYECSCFEKLTVESVLPTPTREGYVFLGWFLNGEKVESISADCTLVAEWKEEVYEVSFNANGGLIAGLDLEAFTEELITLFNSTGKSDAVTTTKENFKGSSHPNIRNMAS